MTFVVPSSAKFAVNGTHRKAHSYCETCRRMKAREGKSFKGWACADCRQAQAERFAVVDGKVSQA